MSERRQEILRRLRPAMVALRDAEDYARLDLHDEVLADRIRGVHESLTDDVLRGTSYRLSDRWRAKLWDRYCGLRGHAPHAGAISRWRTLSRAQRRAAA